MSDYKQLWDNCLVDLETAVSKANFSTWFKNTYIIKEENGLVLLGVPNEFVKDWLSEKFHKTILKTVRNLSENVKEIEYVIIRQKPKENEQKIEIIDETNNKQGPNKELPLINLYLDKESGLNSRYKFGSFIVGSFNELAYAASQAIIHRPGDVYNPFFIYGKTGLGKTHLIQAIGNSIKENYPEKKVLYLTFEKFSIDYINAVQSNKQNQFKEKYRKYDVLIMDDIQFISNKEKTQDELFHLFNELYNVGKQIIFSSDKHPNYIPNLEDRLKSRFGAGMIVDILEPEYESRVAILNAKLKETNATIINEVIAYIASAVEGNIRELEGLLNSIICQSQFKNRGLTVPEVKNLIKNNIKTKKNISIEEIAKVVSNFYNLEEDLVYEKTRRKEVVKTRQIIMYILREDFNVSYPLIGQKLGGKDHTTVIHSCSKVEKELKNNPSLIQEIEQIRTFLK